MGFDSDHPRAGGEVGKVGVAICSLEDMQMLFEGIPLAHVSTSMTINSTAAILLALYVAVARQQGANLEKLSGTVQNDILKEYIARGTYIYPPRPAMRIVTDVFAWCKEELPNVLANYEKYHSRGFEVVGVSLDEDKPTLIKFLEERKIPWPILFGDAKQFVGGIVRELSGGH